MIDPVSVLKSMDFARDGSVALYHQFAARVREAIRRGDLAPGDRLPPAKDCARLASLSLGTVHRGLLELQDAGEIVARQRVGTFVADKEHRQSEIIICSGPHAMENQFESHVMESLVNNSPNRNAHLAFTCLRREQYAPRDLLRLFRQRRPIALIAYRPGPQAFEGFRAMTEFVPVVSLIHRIPDAKVDAICVDAYTPTCQALRRHLEKGYTRFACVAPLALLDGHVPTAGERSDSPYVQMALACLDTASRDGVELTMITPKEGGNIGGDSDNAGKRALKLPSDVVIIAATPRVVLRLWDAGHSAPIITYTESEGSLRMCSPKATTIYQSTKAIAEEAASALRNLAHTTGRVVTLRPELHMAEAL